MLQRIVQGFIFFVVCLLLSVSAVADYTKHNETMNFIDEMVTEHNFDRSFLLSVFKEADQKESILEAIARPAEKRLEWFEYRKIFITKDRVKKGLAFIDDNKTALKKAESEFGVPKEIIASIIGVETRYGKHKGNYKVIDALSTLGFDYPPRSKFFRSELKHALLLAREQGFDILEMKGSYAGAMGFGQFIPSSYRHYAIDYDGDGVADILNNVTDAIGSVANYFAQHNWKRNEPVAVLLSDGNTSKSIASFYSKSLKPAFLLDDIRASGVIIPDTLDGNLHGKIQKYVLESGEQNWLTLHNFYVITRYNHSHLYAMAVYHLAKELGLEL